MANPVEVWKSAKHPFDVWPDVERHAAAGTSMKDIDTADLERMKWHGFFYRKRDAPGRYMNRTRITAGELTAEKAREIALIAYEYGHGIIDVTTRANIQVQGLEIQHLPRVAARLANVGLTAKQTGHDNIRNVFAHPFAGLMPDELFDTRALCHEITELFVDNREYSDLPRKLNICLNGTEHHSSHFWTQDVSFLAMPTDDGVMFQVLLGGTQGQNPRLAWHLPVLVRPEQVVEVTRAILELFRAHGSREKRNAARLRFLIERIGIGGVLDWLEEHLPFPLQPCVQEPMPASTYDELIGWFRQADVRCWTMGLAIPLGRLTWQQLEGLAVLSRKWGDGNLRTTHEQGIAVVNIPTAFKDAAATAAAALGLSVHADAFDRNTMACTGSQFCNIAVTDTKGHMFQLIERLRKKALKLHGIRIHMSGCPSSCAQHFTADVGLKGVRVRRLLGTREGFDVFLGGGISGRVHMGLPYKLGVDVDQLPTLIDGIVNEYYLRHKPGQTFSAYWREVLKAQEAQKVGDDDYQPPVWVCENCEHLHTGEDPPVFCPACAGLRRNFARIAEGECETAGQSDKWTVGEVRREDEFVFAAESDAVLHSAGVTVVVQGQEYALFRVNGDVFAIDSACPHEGAPLGEGEIQDGVVTCPWHAWTFNTCTGCSVEPVGNDVRRYETLEEDGKVFLKPATAGGADRETLGPSDKETSPLSDGPRVRQTARAVTARLPVLDVITEAPGVRTFRLDNSAASIPLDYPGKFVKVRVPIDGEDVWRSFTICSSPTDARFIDLTIKRNPDGVVSNYLFDSVSTGDSLSIKGPLGGFYFDPERHTEPLVLISAGSGITPMMSIARFLTGTGNTPACTFLSGARTSADMLFHDECLRLAEEHESFRYRVTLSQPGDTWEGPRGRISMETVQDSVESLAGNRYFLCGPNDFMDALRDGLTAAGVPSERIHTEQFHTTQSPVTV